ncbi:retrovirus-related Pol polyprotein from transposon 17.6 [Trichonephila clavipes]|nr:retrovirus-related Pol polyprotein from transposon 17.6 [Trichonephila clavipes]
MAFLGKRKKQDMLQLAEELGINATLNMTVPSIKIAITNSEGYYEENLLKICMRLSLQTEKIGRTKAAVCGNHLNQHGRYLLGNKTAELIKGNLGYNFLPVEILNAVQTRSQVKAAREERGIDSGDAKKGKMRHSSVYHPQSNPVERFHRTLKRLLRVLCLDAGSEWDKHLPSILLALRTVSHESTGYTPSELVYGKNLRTPETLVMEHWMEPEEEGDLVTEYMFKLINRLKDVKK